MNFELRYFTGTGNSLRILETCYNIFIQENNTGVISNIIPEETKIIDSDILGFCFPVYAFGIPRICRKYLKALKRFNNKQKTFIVITAGDPVESGFSVIECERFLKKKNCEIIYSAIVKMPVNWITSPEPPFPPSKEEAIDIINNGIIQAKIIAHDIINGIRKFHSFNYPERYPKLRFYKDYWLFKYLGISNLWRTFKVYETCNGCQICAKICPTKSIKIVEKKPVWASTCEQCMRCVNYCPQEAIYQSMGGDTKGKNRYFEPGFNPVKNNNRT